MNKLLFSLIAAVIAASSFSAFAADTVAPKAGAMTPAPAVKEAAPAAADTAAPMMHMRHREPRNPAQAAMRESCKKNADEQTLKGADRKTFIRECIRKDMAAAAAKKNAAVPAAKEIVADPAVKIDAAAPAAKK